MPKYLPARIKLANQNKINKTKEKLNLFIRQSAETRTLVSAPCEMLNFVGKSLTFCSTGW